MDALWLGDKHVLVAKYFEREAKNDELIMFKLPDGSEFRVIASELEADSGKELVDMTVEKDRQRRDRGQNTATSSPRA